MSISSLSWRWGWRWVCSVCACVCACTLTHDVCMRVCVALSICFYVTHTLYKGYLDVSPRRHETPAGPDESTCNKPWPRHVCIWICVQRMHASVHISYWTAGWNLNQLLSFFPHIPIRKNFFPGKEKQKMFRGELKIEITNQAES